MRIILNTIKKVLLIMLVHLGFTISTIVAQNDTMYIMKNGAVLGQYNVNTEVDSIIFYNPILTSSNIITDIYGNIYQPVTNPITGRIWLDRNLGALQVATSSTDSLAYGDLYQWGRGADGHQFINSDITSYLSSTDDPGHSDFITDTIWRSPQNDSLWQGVNGKNNPCPSGYRLPTWSEWADEMATWETDDAAGAFASPLKLTMAGYRDCNDGSLQFWGTGLYWSSYNPGYIAGALYFHTNSSTMQTLYRTYGASVRCIEAEKIETPEVPTVTTDFIKYVSHNFADIISHIDSNGGRDILAYGIVWDTIPNPTIENKLGITSESIISNSFLSTLTGLESSTKYYIRAYATNSLGTAYGNELNFTTEIFDPNIIKDADGNSYTSVVIGNQEWMVENLRTTRYNNGTKLLKVNLVGDYYSGISPGYGWCDNDSVSYDIIYGKLYNYYTVADTNNKNICPIGWHVPKYPEWTSLINQLGGSTVAGGKMKSTGTQFWNSPNSGATNESGFSGLPGGYVSFGGSNQLGKRAYFWSSSADGSYSAFARFLRYDFADFTSTSNSMKYFLSVRCIKD